MVNSQLNNGRLEKDQHNQRRDPSKEGLNLKRRECLALAGILTTGTAGCLESLNGEDQSSRSTTTPTYGYGGTPVTESRDEKSNTTDSESSQQWSRQLLLGEKYTGTLSEADAAWYAIDAAQAERVYVDIIRDRPSRLELVLFDEDGEQRTLKKLGPGVTRVAFDVDPASERYFVKVEALNGGTGTFTISVNSPTDSTLDSQPTNIDTTTTTESLVCSTTDSSQDRGTINSPPGPPSCGPSNQSAGPRSPTTEPSGTPESTSTPTQSETSSPALNSPPTPTASSPAEPTQKPTESSTPTETTTPTSASTEPSTPTETETPTPTPSPTPTPTETETPTPTPTSTSTETTTATPTPTPRPVDDEFGRQGYGEYGYGGVE